MRLKLSVYRGEAPPADVQVTVDATATVGDVARFFAAAGRADSEEDPGERVTLRMAAPSDTEYRLLNPLLPVHESALRSGCAIEVVAVNLNQVHANLYGRPVAYVRVTGGPDEGAEFGIAAGVNYIGRDPAAQISLSDKTVSRRHATITVAESTTITDLNSANGVEVDGAVVSRAMLSSRTKIRIGDSELELAPLASSVALPTAPPPGAAAESEAHDDSALVGFTRSPRVDPAYRGRSFQAPELPGIPERARFPMLAVISPILLGAVLYFVTQQVFSLIFIALSPLIMLGTWVDNRIQNKRKLRDENARFTGSIAATRESLEAEREREVAARTAESPSITEVVEAIQQRSPLLWTRKPEHSTFLEVRLGTGTQPSRNAVVAPSRNSSSPEDWRSISDLVEQFSTVDGVPVVERFERAGAIGVAGASEAAAGAAQAIVLQLAGLHSPADLVITAFGAGDASVQWSWLKWLPHVDSAFNPVKSPGLAADFASASVLLSELEGLIAQRRASGATEQIRSRLHEEMILDAEHGSAVERLPATPAVLAIVTPESPADRARLVALGNEGPDVGVFLLWLAPRVEGLPVICRTYLDVGEAGSPARAGFVRQGRVVELESVERLDDATAAGAARLLAPVEDVGAQVLDESDLPRSVGFLDLFEGAVADTPDAVVQRWAKNDSLTAAWTPGTFREPGGIRALVGQGPVEPFFLDIRRHGPHALVGGTTGSGKSEFLQTWIMGMATEYSPDRVNFLLIDYKGGAAFAECVTLPHTVGLVTDLNRHLVRRALTSLRAELKYREELLNRKGAKDLEALEKSSDPEAPAVLLIIIDEFAALVGEVPEFVDGVIDVAQRGRSLGLHLVMATQRPAGVIKDNLRANTNLRVALRVADEADSVDVLGIDRAALFDPGTPGRAAAKLGPGRVLDFQTAYLGGWTTANSVSTSDVEVTALEFGRGADWVVPQTSEDQREGLPKDIERLAMTLIAAAERQGLREARKPWIDQLADVYDLDSLPQDGDTALVLGVLDDPETQSQHDFELSLDEAGNCAVFGTGGSGKSTLLRTVAIAASRAAATHPISVYGLDFGGGGLASIEALPTVGSIIDGGDVERITRLLKDLNDEAEERTKRYSAARASTLTDYRRLTGDTAERRIVVLVDGMSALRADYEFHGSGNLFDRLIKLASMGRQVGIHFIFSADRLAAFPPTLMTTIQEKVVLRMAGEHDYSMLGVPGDVLTDAPPGRALIGTQELQIAVVGGSAALDDQSAATAALAEQLMAAGVTPAVEIERLGELIPASSLPPTVGGLPTLGVSDETLEPVGIPLDGLFLVSGPYGSGRTTAMTTIIRSVAAARPELVPHLFVARRSELGGAAKWGSVSADATEAESLANELATRLEGPAAERDPNLLVVVENVGDFEGLGADAAVARLLKAARRADVPVLVESDTVTASSAWQIYSELKTARAGIVLQPEETDGISLFRVQFPRVTRSDFPVGRGILVSSGQLSRVQVAFSDVV